MTHSQEGVPDQSGAEGCNLNWQLMQHWPCNASSQSTGMCWNASRYSNTLLVACLQDNNDAQAIWQQLWKARGVWGGQVLHGESTSLRVAPKLYKAVVQALLLYGSETWNLTESALVQLERFHVRAVYKMARVHLPKKRTAGVWQYPSTTGDLEEYGIESIATYVQVHCQTIATYVAT